MPWWAATYLIAHALLAPVAAMSQWREAIRPRWHALLDLAAAALMIPLASAAWHPGLLAPIGRLAVLPFVACVGWEAYSSGCDLANERNDPDLSESANRAALHIALLLTAGWLAPLYGLALYAVVTVWRAAA